MKVSDEPIVIQIKTQASISSIWRAFTLLSELRQWLFAEIPSFVAEEGFSTEFDILAGERTFNHVWVVKEVIKKEKIVVEWSYTGYEGKGDVSYEIIKDRLHNIIRVTNTVTQDFDNNIPEFKRESAVNGWKYFVQDRLVKYLS